MAKQLRYNGAAHSMPGTTLLHYRIVRPLGRGGMGEVYAAEDTRLNRTVALKMLPEIAGADPERLKRFQREARAIAVLNHRMSSRSIRSRRRTASPSSRWSSSRASGSTR